MGLLNLWTLACCLQQCSVNFLSPPSMFNHFPFYSLLYFPEEYTFSTEISRCYQVFWGGRNPAQQTWPPLTVVGLHPKPCASRVPCSPEQAAFLSTSELKAESERNLKADRAVLSGPVGDCLYLWLEGLLKSPTQGPHSHHWSTWPAIQKSGTIGSRPLINSMLWNKLLRVRGT